MSKSVSDYSNLAALDPKSVPLDAIDPSQLDLYPKQAHWAYFERLRKEDPVHYCVDSAHGPYWSITKFNDLVEIERDFQQFSSEPVVSLADMVENVDYQGFIAMDPPRHTEQRAVVQGAVAPSTLALLEPLIRERAGKILDQLPVGETFDWVDRVSIELTSQMLATLFDFPFDDRRKLTYWSDVITESASGEGGFSISREEVDAAFADMVATFTKMWHERASGPLRNDFISMLSHGGATKDQINNLAQFMGNLMLLIVGGNDTTRNSITGGILALNRFPEEYRKLRNNHSLIPSMVSEIIRYQTPVISMRRNATRDTVFRGKNIRKGDKIALWYISANRDDEVIENPNSFIIDRKNPRHHLSFGFGIHRCMGNRLAEMQLRIIWEEIMNRFSEIEVVGEVTWARSAVVHGILELPVRVKPL